MGSRLEAIDDGFASQKYLTKNFMGMVQTGNFPSRINQTQDVFLKTDNTDILIFEDKINVIGEGANQDALEPDKTSNEFHRLFIYNSIGRILPSEKEVIPINIIVSYPLNYYSQESRKQYIEYLKYKDEINIIQNSKPKNFSINKCIIFPQCAGALYPNISYCKDQIVGVVDIGGGTIQGCVFKNLNLVSDSKFTEQRGCLMFFNEVKNELIKNFSGCNPQDYEMPFIIENGLLSKQNESLKIIKEMKTNYILKLESVLRRNQWNIGNIRLLFIGGGSLLLKDEIREVFPESVISNDPVYDTVKGLYMVGERYES
jgi:plasmid segregation protein ParM